MASGAQLRSKISRVLKRLNATSRDVYLRDVSGSGGNSRLGIGVTVTTTDTLIDPPPTVDIVKAEEISVSGGLYQLGDYEMLLHGGITEDELRSRLLVYGDEVLKIVHYAPIPMGGVVVAWKVVSRTVQPGS